VIWSRRRKGNIRGERKRKKEKRVSKKEKTERLRRRRFDVVFSEGSVRDRDLPSRWHHIKTHLRTSGRPWLLCGWRPRVLRFGLPRASVNGTRLRSCCRIPTHMAGSTMEVHSAAHCTASRVSDIVTTMSTREHPWQTWNSKRSRYAPAQSVPSVAFTHSSVHVTTERSSKQPMHIYFVRSTMHILFLEEDVQVSNKVCERAM
jgi:hypothetical protein